MATTASSPLHPEFQQELKQLINKHSLDAQANTPDFVLAGILTEHYEAYRKVEEFMRRGTHRGPQNAKAAPTNG